MILKTVGKFSKKGMGLLWELDSIFILTKEIYFLLLELFFISWALKFGFKSTKSLDPGSVADPGCLSRIPDPDFYPSRILIFNSVLNFYFSY